MDERVTTRANMARLAEQRSTYASRSKKEEDERGHTYNGRRGRVNVKTGLRKLTSATWSNFRDKSNYSGYFLKPRYKVRVEENESHLIVRDKRDKEEVLIKNLLQGSSYDMIISH
ncbi:uncharacterized protein LOC143182539 [Calliopsis andreniformis]|uniref:uncharacterized protein LOC143182539 n=1 Tax=Calliopsis andreniformis TaxID=337506 RepID=UPI003FCE911A